MKLKFPLFAILLAGALCLSQVAYSATLLLQKSFTPTATAYTSGNCLGPAGVSAIIALPGAVSGQTGGSLLQNITVTDPTGQDAEVDFLVFKALPTGTYTDAAACSVSNTLTSGSIDTANWIGTVKVTGYSTYGTPGQATTGNLANALNTGSTTSGTLWFVPVVIGTPTYGASKTLYFNFGLLPDGAP